MKKTVTKLQLNTNTIRLLQDSQLEGVVGGAAPRAPTANCSQTPTACSSRDSCPASAGCGH